MSCYTCYLTQVIFGRHCYPVNFYENLDKSKRINFAEKYLKSKGSIKSLLLVSF